MRDRFPLLLISLVLLIGAFGTFLMRGAKRGSFADKLSTYRSEPDGARGLYLLAEQRQLPVHRVQQDLDILTDQKNLVLLAVDFSEKTIKRGKRKELFSAPADAGTDDDDDDFKSDSDLDEDDRLHSGSNVLRAQPVTPSQREKLLEHLKAGQSLVYVPWGHRENALLKALDVQLWKADKGLEMRTLVPGQPTPYTVGVERVEVKIHAFLGLPPGAVPLLIDEKLGEPVAAVVPYGQGEVIVIAAPELAMNKSLTRADNARFWASLLGRVSRTGPIGFDEFHHGFTSARSIANFAERYGLQFAVLQLVLGVCLWALALRRFGRPRPLLVDLRVGSTDALFASSRLYREGRHYAHAGSAIVRELCAEYAAVAAVASKSDAGEIAAALKLRGRADLAAALTDVRRASEVISNEGDVQEIARLAAAARRLLRQKQKTLSPTSSRPRA